MEELTQPGGPGEVLHHPLLHHLLRGGLEGGHLGDEAGGEGDAAPHAHRDHPRGERRVDLRQVRLLSPTLTWFLFCIPDFSISFSSFPSLQQGQKGGIHNSSALVRVMSGM